jgi:DNA repair protein RadC
MDGRSSDHFPLGAFRSRAKCRYGADCLRSPDAGTFLFSDSDPGLRRGRSRQKGASLRHLPFLEAVLEPVAGGRARAVAETLLKRFGTLRQISAAPEGLINRTLTDAPDIAAAIILGRSLNELSHREQLVGEPISLNDASFHRYLIQACNNSLEEQCHAIYLDAAGRFLKMELVGTGALANVSVSFRSLFARTVELAASSIIIVHNHPSGNVRASDDDVIATKEIARLAAALSISLVDHLIVGGNKISSMRQSGYL